MTFHVGRRPVGQKFRSARPRTVSPPYAAISAVARNGAGCPPPHGCPPQATTRPALRSLGDVPIARQTTCRRRTCPRSPSRPFLTRMVVVFRRGHEDHGLPFARFRSHVHRTFRRDQPRSARAKALPSIASPKSRTCGVSARSIVKHRLVAGGERCRRGPNKERRRATSELVSQCPRPAELRIAISPHRLTRRLRSERKLETSGGGREIWSVTGNPAPRSRGRPQKCRPEGSRAFFPGRPC